MRLWSAKDAAAVLQAAADEIWLSIRKWDGNPTQRWNHSLDCQCCDCT